jgi:hypothetical protein
MIYLTFLEASVWRYFCSCKCRRRLRRMCTWHPDTATALPKTDLSKISKINEKISTNVAGYF